MSIALLSVLLFPLSTHTVRMVLVASFVIRLILIYHAPPQLALSFFEEELHPSSPSHALADLETRGRLAWGTFAFFLLAYVVMWGLGLVAEGRAVAKDQRMPDAVEPSGYMARLKSAIHEMSEAMELPTNQMYQQISFGGTVGGPVAEMAAPTSLGMARSRSLTAADKVATALTKMAGPGAVDEVKDVVEACEHVQQWRNAALAQISYGYPSVIMLCLAASFDGPELDYPLVVQPLTAKMAKAIVLSPAMLFPLAMAVVRTASDFPQYSHISVWLTVASSLPWKIMIGVHAGILEELEYRWLLIPLEMWSISWLIWFHSPIDYFLKSVCQIELGYPVAVRFLMKARVALNSVTFEQFDIFLGTASTYSDLYAYAIIATTLGFMLAHAYQGPVGVWLKPIMCLLFHKWQCEFGLLGAMLGHVVWDCIIFIVPFLIGSLGFFISAIFYRGKPRRA